MKDKLKEKIQEKLGEKKIIFFGTGPLAESVLYTLYVSGIIPKTVVTKPDSQIGRHQVLTPPIIKTWCESKNIAVYQPETLKLGALDDTSPLLENYDLAIVASYGKIIPEYLLQVPERGFINVHPSNLPLYRGPSPIQSALLDGLTETAVSIIQLDAGMDHGPILVKQKVHIQNTDTNGSLEKVCGQIGGELLVQIIPHYMDGSLKLQDQDHTKATICKFIEKSQGEVFLPSDTDNDEMLIEKINTIKNKYRALTPWPGVFFFHTHLDKTLRIKINKINLNADNLDTLIVTLTPEGKDQMSWLDFKHGYITKISA